mgnify:CR=1 FL=1
MFCFNSFLYLRLGLSGYLPPLNLTHAVEKSLERAGITCNKNLVPMDSRTPQEASGLRFGVSAMTTRGLDADDFATIGNWIGDILGTAAAVGENVADVTDTIREAALTLARSKPFYTG